jgi:sec-independent protein translocase protein TatB
VFGFSFGEMVVLAVVALVVVGPRNLPTMLRTLGRTIGKLRRMALELRAESGIDKILEAEGIQAEIHNFKRLVSGELIDLDDDDEKKPEERQLSPAREREYPRTGADGDGVVPEDEVGYLQTAAESGEQNPVPGTESPPNAGPAAESGPNGDPAATAEPSAASAAPLPSPAAPPPGPAPRPPVPGAVPAASPFTRPVKNGTSPTS